MLQLVEVLVDGHFGVVKQSAQKRYCALWGL